MSTPHKIAVDTTSITDADFDHGPFVIEVEVRDQGLTSTQVDDQVGDRVQIMAAKQVLGGLSSVLKGAD